MFVRQRLHGQWITEEDFTLAQGLIAAHPQWSRRQLSVEVASLWNATGAGQDLHVVGRCARFFAVPKLFLIYSRLRR